MKIEIYFFSFKVLQIFVSLTKNLIFMMLPFRVKIILLGQSDIRGELELLSLSSQRTMLSF